MYHHPTQAMNTSYDYAPYPHAPYESTQIPLRSIRSSSSQPHSPHPHSQFTSTPSQPPYQSTYTSPPYGISQQSPPQWTSDAWASYSQPFPPPASLPDVPFNSGPGRPEAVPTTSVEQRPYGSSQPAPNPDPRRPTERPPITTSAPTLPVAQPKRRREKETPPTTAGTLVTLPGLDFVKLLDSYRLIIDSSDAFSDDALSTTGRPSPSETVERMLQSASFGAQMLESASLFQTGSPDIRPPLDSDIDGDKEGDGGSPAKRQKIDEAPVQEGQTCLGCNATSTPEWRRGPMGPRTLCNACGLVYAKLIKKRVREGGRPFGKVNGQGTSGPQGLGGDESGLASSGEGGSEDADSYSSPVDRRSDGGEGRD